MRDIKFRAIYKPDAETKDGLLIFHQKIDKSDIDGCRFIHIYKNISKISYPFPVPFLDDDWELMQFTGLHDKNGKEIYEGDVVEFYREQHRQVRQVIWDDYLLCWEFKDRGYIGNLYEEEINSIEIIGNIHENPELLEELV